MSAVPVVRTVIIVIALAGCSAPAASSGAASPNSAAPTASFATATSAGPTGAIAPSPEPTPGVNPAAVVTGPFVPELAVRVVVDQLAVRTEPSTSAPTVGTLDRDDVLVLHRWPSNAEGATWYRATRVASDGALPALPAYPLADQYSKLGGWVAIESGTTVSVEPIRARCPTNVNLVNVSGMLGSEYVACFGGTTIELQGIFGCGGCGGEALGTYAPRWLIDPFGFGLLSVEPNEMRGPLSLHFPPDGVAEPDGASIIRVRGHFDDPRSLSCVVALGSVTDPMAYPLAPALATGACRQSFVVETYKVLGVDPDFPFG